MNDVCMWDGTSGYATDRANQTNLKMSPSLRLFCKAVGHWRAKIRSRIINRRTRMLDWIKQKLAGVQQLFDKAKANQQQIADDVNEVKTLAQEAKQIEQAAQGKTDDPA